MPRQLRVFVSHREEDRPLARAIAGRLVDLSDGAVDCLICDEIPGGKDWRAWIDQGTRAADALLLLYTTDDADWRWCIYEVGLFRGARMQPSAPAPVLCFMPERLEVPGFIADIQLYRVSRDDVGRFLRELVAERVWPDGTPLVADFMARKAKAFQAAVDALHRELTGLARYEEYFHRRLVLRMSGLDELAAASPGFGQMPPADQAMTLARSAQLDARPGTLAFLGVEAGAGWDALERVQEEEESPEWLHDLVAYLMASLPSGTPEARDGREQILTGMRRGPRCFLPVIARMEYQDDWPVTLVLIFVRMPALSEDAHQMRKLGMPVEVVTLAVLERLTRLFRWGVVELLARPLEAMGEQADPGNVYWATFDRQLAQALKVIGHVEREGARLGALQTPRSARDEAGLDGERDLMDRLWRSYPERKRRLLDAAAARDAAAMRAVLADWQVDTKRFMLAVNARLGEEIALLDPLAGIGPQLAAATGCREAVTAGV